MNSINVRRVLNAQVLAFNVGRRGLVVYNSTVEASGFKSHLGLRRLCVQGTYTTLLDLG